MQCLKMKNSKTQEDVSGRADVYYFWGQGLLGPGEEGGDEDTCENRTPAEKGVQGRGLWVGFEGEVGGGTAQVDVSLTLDLLSSEPISLVK